jgi:hypothetical protein
MELDENTLPVLLKNALRELEKELAEGDITPQGYQKKREKILGAYAASLRDEGPPPTPPSATKPGSVPVSGRWQAVGRWS